MTKKDFAILEAAIMAAQVVRNEYNFRRVASFLCSFTFQGAACKLEVVAGNEEEAREIALQMTKKKFSARYARVITRKELDAPGLDTQRHLLWWRDHVAEVGSMDVWQWLCKNGRYIGYGYKAEKLLEVWPMVPVAWFKRAGVCDKAA